jgi:hypothetical protein
MSINFSGTANMARAGLGGAMLALAIVMSAGTAAQKHESTLGEAGRIASQPGRDIGAIKRKIPPVLRQAANNPYAIADTASCSALAAAVSNLDDAIGPDFGHATTRKGSRVGTVARMGGTAVVDSLIPFRGLVREVSGAAKSDREFAAAVNAGYARRGFLRGISVARRCRPAL